MLIYDDYTLGLSIYCTNTVCLLTLIYLACTVNARSDGITFIILQTQCECVCFQGVVL